MLQNQEKAVSLMNKLLSKVVSLQTNPEGSRDRLKALAVNMAER